MSAFFGVLLGDAWNVAVMAVIAFVAVALTASSHGSSATYAILALTVEGVALLPQRKGWCARSPSKYSAEQNVSG